MSDVDELSEARELIIKSEWAGYNGIGPSCPICNGTKPGWAESPEYDGHTPNCRLAAWLTAHPEA